MSRTAAIVIGCALALWSRNATAQWGDFLKDRIQQKAEQKAGEAVDEAADGATRGGREEPAQAREAPADEEEDAPKPKRRAAAPAPAPAPAPAQASGKAAAEPAKAAEEVAAGEVYGNKFDFVPGDKVLLYDDFTETSVGDYPARWTIKEGGGNPTEVVSYKGRKWFKSVRGEDGNAYSVHWLRYAPKGDLPKKFTIEFDADMAGHFSVLFNLQRNFGGREIRFDRETIATEQVHTTVKRAGPVVKRVSISVNGTYLKVYVGGERVLQDPDGIERPVTKIGFRFDQMEPYLEGALDHQLMTAFRLAEGGKDVTQALNTDGRIVVHGIYFDTGSDVIRPESGGALRNIQQLLESDTGLRFRIEGHTDDQGGPAVNGPLSERRAAAVKTWLVRQGIDAKRLESKGLGATKPIDTNATQEGRANNRRVEFVKLTAVGSR